MSPKPTKVTTECLKNFKMVKKSWPEIECKNQFLVENLGFQAVSKEKYGLIVVVFWAALPARLLQWLLPIFRLTF